MISGYKSNPTIIKKKVIYRIICLLCFFSLQAQTISFFLFLTHKKKNKTVSKAKGSLKNSNCVNIVNAPLEMPKNRNKKAGKQQSVDNKAVITAPVI